MCWIGFMKMCLCKQWDQIEAIDLFGGGVMEE